MHRQPGQAPGAAAGLHPAHRPDGGLPAAAAAEAPALLLRPDGVPQQPGPVREKRRVRPDGHRAHGGTGPAGGPGGHRRGGGGTVHLRGEFPGGDRPRRVLPGPGRPAAPVSGGAGAAADHHRVEELRGPLRAAGPPGAHPGGGGHAPAAPAFRRAGGAGPGGALVRRGRRPDAGVPADPVQRPGAAGPGGQAHGGLRAGAAQRLLHRHGVLRLCGGPGGRGAPGRPVRQAL